MDRQALVEAARLAREGAYVPYSRFQVGAALRTRDGRVFTGCNIENASYPLCNCAERTALFSAIAAGMRPGEVAELAVIGDTEGPISPCGACRQVMLELCAPDTPVILANLGDARLVTTVGELLPFGFSGRDLGVV
ncbi:cytidine deaminase [Leeia aquatica]|uniref:Cytidine deaminase n=1 Tax=Leeia aquatica TaxID=2725557 RepID=A0A847S581_9NEIS|nr:cytidine deaminase [Leeia aquatica]NLR74984.1 cytidine deaminase [Leeia aquatica]